MLLCQQGGWYQNRDLPIILHCNKCGTHRDFCLAETDITTHQSIHRFGLLHILQRSFNGIGLIRCFFISKATGKLHIQALIDFKTDPGLGSTTCLNMQQFGRDIVNLFQRFTFGFIPRICTQFMQRCQIRITTTIPAD